MSDVEHLFMCLLVMFLKHLSFLFPSFKTPVCPLKFSDGFGDLSIFVLVILRITSSRFINHRLSFCLSVAIVVTWKTYS